MTRIEAATPWFRQLGAEERAWVGQVLQAGVRAFVDWYGDDDGAGGADSDGATASFAVAASVFGAAPRALAGTISLQQTVELVRLSIDVVEREIGGLLHPDDVEEVHGAVLRYGREIAFATAEVYARAAEVRGAWDARLEALVVDGVLRGEADDVVLSRANALGWGVRRDVAVVVCSLPAPPAGQDGATAQSGTFDAVRRAVQAAGAEALCAAQADRLVVLLGGVDDLTRTAATVVTHAGPGAVVAGPVVPDLTSAHLSAQAALAGHRAAPGWPEAPCPVLSDDLLPERALAGDPLAQRHLVEEVHAALLSAKGSLEETLASYLAHGGSVEGTARALYVHPNTVRYRLRQIAEATGHAPGTARGALTLQVALVLGRQAAAGSGVNGG
ncbi:MAG: PucR family transcriptional regulator [Nocardioides sp.]|nr:PucR family transcriptional regulator [Nocardioides sp.]